jgi:hypothetical protein
MDLPEPFFTSPICQCITSPAQLSIYLKYSGNIGWILNDMQQVQNNQDEHNDDQSMDPTASSREA